MRYSPSREPGMCILCHSIYWQVIKVHWFKLFDKLGLLFLLVLDYRWITTLFRSSFRKPKRFCSLCRLRIPVSISVRDCTQELKPDMSYDQIFLQRSTQNFEIRRRVPRVKNKLAKFKKNTHTHLSLSICRSADAMFNLMCLHHFLYLSLSLSLSTCRSADAMFTLMCLHQSLSLSLLVDPPMQCLLWPACTSLSLSLFIFANTVWIQIRPEWYWGYNVSSI